MDDGLGDLRRSSDVRGNDCLISKVPRVTLAFWGIKLLATTVGETGGDALSMTLGLGYAVASMIYIAFFAITVATQVSSKRYHPFAYWAVVVATTTVGTTMSDYLDRTIGLGLRTRCRDEASCTRKQAALHPDRRASPADEAACSHQGDRTRTSKGREDDDYRGAL
jgi:hypothetical protein